MSVGANSFAQSVSRNKTTQAQRVVAFPTQAAYAGNALLATLVKPYSGLHKFLIGLETIKKHRRGVLHTPLRSSPQCYRSCVGMLTIICVDTYGKGRVDIGF